MSEIPAVIGPYKITRKLGEGGMGAVYEALHQNIERRVAIKVLHPEYATRAEFIERFFNEARAVNRILHPGLVQISDYGQLPNGIAYIVMEYLHGESLGQRLKRLGGALPSADVLRLGGLLADSLAAAHERGIIHRDLKPDNVMIVADPNVPGGERTKLLDFGIAKLSDGKDVSKTRSNVMMGTPLFMSPEQCRGAGKVNDRADVYSFGVMLFVMLAGKPPFDGEGPGEVVGKHLFLPAPSLAGIQPAAPPQIAALVDRLLLKDPAQRPSMRQVVDELARLAGTPLTTRSTLGADGSSGPSFVGSTAGTIRAAPSLMWRRRGVLAAAVLVIAALATLLGIFSERFRRPALLPQVVPVAPVAPVAVQLEPSPPPPEKPLPKSDPSAAESPTAVRRVPGVGASSGTPPTSAKKPASLRQVAPPATAKPPTPTKTINVKRDIEE